MASLTLGYEQHPRRGEYQPGPHPEHNITIAVLDIVFDDLQACSKPSVTSARSKDRANPKLVAALRAHDAAFDRQRGVDYRKQAAYMTNGLLPIVAVASET